MCDLTQGITQTPATQLYAVRYYLGVNSTLHAQFAAEDIDQAHEKAKNWLVWPMQLGLSNKVTAIAVCEGCDFALHRSKVFL